MGTLIIDEVVNGFIVESISGGVCYKFVEFTLDAALQHAIPLFTGDTKKNVIIEDIEEEEN